MQRTQKHDRDTLQQQLLKPLEDAMANENVIHKFLGEHRTNSGTILKEGQTPRSERKRSRGRDGIFVRRGAFYISYVDAQGRRKQRKTQGHTLKQARDIRAAELAKAERARVLGYVEPTESTFAEVMPRYLKHQRARLTPAAYERSRGILETHLRPVFGNMRLADIKRAHAQAYVTDRCAEVAPATVVHELNTLKHFLNMATEWELIAVNPCTRLKPPRVPPGRIRYLQPTELRVVLEACPEWLRPIIVLLVCTGMRRSEVLNLRWLDVDRPGNRILLPQTKNGEGRVVFLNLLACQALDSIMRENAKPTDRVFPPSEHISPENVSLRFLRACRKIGVLNFRLHDLRHTAASWLRMKGADIHTVAQLLGHKDLRMAARYQHLSPAYLQSAVNGLDSAFGPELSKVPALIGASQKTLRVGDHDEVTIEDKNASEPLQALAS